MSVFSIIIAVVAVHLQVVNGLDILGVFTLPLKSHYMAFRPLFEELAARGHKVTVLGNFPRSEPLKNYRDIDVKSPGNVSYRMTPLAFYDALPKRLHNAYNFYIHVVNTPKMVTDDCENLFTNTDLKQLVTSGATFDVIFVEQFISECSLPFASAFYEGVPVIGITSHALLPWAYKRFGLPFRLSSDAFYFSPGGQAATVLQKLESVLLKFYFNTIAKWHIQGNIKAVLDEHFPNNIMDVENMARNIRMIFSYQYFTLTGSRLLTPQVLEIGGLHIDRPKALPKEIEDFVEKSPNGVIYVSFGSMLKPSTLSQVKMEAFLGAFESLAQRVLWKFDNETLLTNYDTSKVMTKSWFPQLDILCHPNVIGFVSHGGMLGTSEAISCGVPVVVIPFFGDQFANSASIRDSGLGVPLYFQDITKDTLLEALTDITSSKRQHRAKVLSTLWHDRPQSPMDAAIFWTEHVARHRHLSPPEPSAKHTTPIQDLLLDVYSLLAAIMLVVLGGLYGAGVAVKWLLVRLVKRVMCKRKVE